MKDRHPDADVVDNEWVDTIRKVIDDIKILEDESAVDQVTMPSYNSGKVVGLFTARKIIEELI